MRLEEDRQTEIALSIPRGELAECNVTAGSKMDNTVQTAECNVTAGSKMDNTVQTAECYVKAGSKMDNTAQTAECYVGAGRKRLGKFEVYPKVVSRYRICCKSDL
ncbi:hypothetical protein Btru_065375 [Bulinus truncatus]|nr:hypothetical protein Btru_065375 [Bulinus truncatus]